MLASTGSLITTLAAVQAVWSQGLDLSLHGTYEVEVSLKNATGTVGTLALYYNGDTTSTNYYRQTLFSSGTTISASRGSDALFTELPENENTLCHFKITADRDGRPRANSDAVSNTSPAAIQLRVFIHIRDNTANVTSLTISSSVANSLAVGSYIKVWALK